MEESRVAAALNHNWQPNMPLYVTTKNTLESEAFLLNYRLTSLSRCVQKIVSIAGLLHLNLSEIATKVARLLIMGLIVLTVIWGI
jgi:hypothetical protein